ncbi:MAG: hypothetical protein EOO36_12340 [Cytophagaceae bacterium]|nr:MAG: hypothetical protein EOO36_12340 [Cytophagaceae bacterium]
MFQAKSSWALALLLASGALLSACGSKTGNTSTSTPTSTLGTDSAATKVGGMPPADTTATGR